MAVTSLYVAEAPGSGVPGADICTLEINIKDDVVPSLVCSACFSLGIIYCFFGYRCFKAVMFLSGFMFSSGAMFLLTHQEPTLNALGTEAKAGVGLGVGVLCGLAAVLVPALGLLLSGLQLGSLLSLAALLVIGHFHSLAPVWLPLSATLASGIATAAFALRWQKVFTVIHTSVFGATVVTLCVDYLLGSSALADRARGVLCEDAPHPLCWSNWAITGMWPVMSLLGALVQWRFTAKGISHNETAYQVQKKYAKKLRYTEPRRRPQTHRRRRPPTLRRYTGDVLAPVSPRGQSSSLGMALSHVFFPSTFQSYLQRLQERQLGTGSSTSSTAIGAVTHPLIDFDYETGSMVPLTAAASPVFTV